MLTLQRKKKEVHSTKDNKPLRRAERQHTRGALLILDSNGIHRDALLPKFIFCQWGELLQAIYLLDLDLLHS